MWSNMDWFGAFYVHLWSCMQEHACACPRAWQCAVAPQCSSCWWRNKIPFPLRQILFSRLHSIWHLALSHTKDKDQRLYFSVCRRNLTQCTTIPHSCTKIWFPEVLAAMAGSTEQVYICIGSTLIVTGLGFICTYFTKNYMSPRNCLTFMPYCNFWNTKLQPNQAHLIIYLCIAVWPGAWWPNS